MSPDDRDLDDQEPEEHYEGSPRSIFSALWFRVVLVVIGLGIIGALAVPYVLEWVNPQPPKTTVLKPTPPAAKPPAQSAPATPPAAVPAAPAPTAPSTPPASAATRAPAPAPPPAVAKPAAPPAPAPAPMMAQGEQPKPPRARRAAKPAVAKAPAAGGAWFIQVGAFREPERARKLAVTLREQKFSVDESSATPEQEGRAKAAPPPPAAAGRAAGDTYDVFVSGGSAADISAKLTAKGLATERSGNGVVVKPSLPLRDAVALSKDLAVEGLKVQVRRAGAGAPASAGAPATATPAVTTGDGEGLYRVRVGPYANRAAAAAALGGLEAKGYKGFITRGGG
jgi:hypothetical protein